MGNNINGGVNENSLAKLKAIIADGQVEAKELAGLSETEKEALQKYLQGEGKDLPLDGEIVYLKEPVAQNDNRSNGQILWDAVSGAIGKVIGGVLALTPLGLVACSQGDNVTNLPDYDIDSDTTVNVNLFNNTELESIYNAFSKLIADLMAKIDEKDAKNDAKWKELLDLQKTMLTTLKTMQSSINNADTANQKLLAAILDKLDAIFSASKDNAKANEDIIKLLTQIAKTVNKMSVDQAGFFNKVLEKIDKLEATTVQAFTALAEKADAYGAEISNAINLFIDNYDNMSEKQIKKFDQIINLLAQLPTQDQVNNVGDLVAELIKLVKNKTAVDAKYYNEIMSKLDTMNKEEAEFHAAVLAKLDTLTPQQQADLTGIYNAIKENTEVAKKTYVTTTLILEGLDFLKANAEKLNLKVDDAINVLKQLATKDPEKCNFDQKQLEAFFTATINGMMEQFKAQHKEALDNEDANTKAVLDALQAILDKIPNGCNCKPADLSGVLELLQKINEKLEQEKPSLDENPDSGTHEGIIGDLEDLFG